MLVLASSSPRRQALIEHLGISVDVEASTVDESRLSSAGSPADFVVRAAEAKARDVAAHRPGDTVIGSDTVVVHAGRRLGKPADRADAEATLTAMSGRSVDIHTGIAVVSDGRCETELVSGACQLIELDASTLDGYLASGIWRDKAGSLAIQHQKPSLVISVSGCLPSTLGLPLCRLAAMLGHTSLDAADQRAIGSFSCGPDRADCPISVTTLAGL